MVLFRLKDTSDQTRATQLISSNRIQKRQEDILNVATELFLERGYDAVSLDDILHRVGGSKTTLYSYYGCKEGLFTAMIQKMCQEKLGALEVDVTHLTPQAGLSALGRQFLAIVLDSRGNALFRAMISEAQRFPELATAFYAAGPAVFIRLLRRNIVYWQKKSLLRYGNSELMAIQFLGILIGNFHLKSLLNLMPPLTDKQIRSWVDRGVELFLSGASRGPITG